jgi:alkylhydroperoxidase family enzyme
MSNPTLHHVNLKTTRLREMIEWYGTVVGLKPQHVDPVGAFLTNDAASHQGRLPKDGTLAALSALARTMIEKRGRLNDQDIDQFIAAGFGKDHALEVIAAVAASTITNYTGSITKPPLEAPFQEHAWAA